MNWLAGRWIRYSGLGIALLGFGITRLFVAESVRADAALPFFLVGLVPLVIGLTVTIYGVVLAVGAFSRTYVNTVAQWCFAGIGIALFVLSLTFLSGLVQDNVMRPFTESPLLVANVLLGGLVAGVAIGDRSAVNRRQRRSIDRQANRALFVNRLLRHEVINAATIIDGYAGVLAESRTDGGQHNDGRRDDSQTDDAVDAIRDSVEQIETTVEEIGMIGAEENSHGPDSIDVWEPLKREIDRLRDQHPDVTVRVSRHTDNFTATAGWGLCLVFRELLDNAVEHGDGETIDVEVDRSGPELSVSISNSGSRFPGRQRQLLEDGEFPRYDDPNAGFGLQTVRLLVDRYGGRIDVPDTDRPTVTVRLPRHSGSQGVRATAGVTFPGLSHSVLAGVVAGIAMGGVFVAATGLFPIIGALYGVELPVVGWITHLFHSIVFALLFAAGYARLVPRDDITIPTRPLTLGVGWGIALWFVAAGLVMPVWLRLVGIHEPIPNLTTVGLAGHLVWGAVLGVTYYALQQSRNTTDSE